MPRDLRTLKRAALALALLSGVASPARAQVKPDSTPVTISGVVTDRTARGVPDVEVSIPSLKLLVRSDSAGAFRFVNIVPGVYYFRARRVGYNPVDLRFPVSAPPRPMRIIVTQVDVTLDTTVVHAKCDPRGYSGFVCRSNAHGGGTFLDAAAIDSTKADIIGDLFNDKKGFRVNVNPRNGLKYPTMTGGMCLVTLVDGIPASSTNPLPVYARQLTGVEIYDKPMDAPMAYQQYSWKPGRQPCGLIAYWTGRSR